MTFVIVMLSDTLPPNRDTVAHISTYFSGLTVVIGLLILENIMVYRVASRDDEKKQAKPGRIWRQVSKIKIY